MKYLNGIIGAFIGAIIGSIPWLLVYVYGGWIIALLAMPIALAADWGYKLMGGEQTKALGKIVAIVTILVVALQIFIIIPLFMLNNAGMSTSLGSLLSLYEDSAILTGILRDAFISLIFAFIGISSVIKNIDAYGSNEPIWKTNKRRNNLIQEQNTNAIIDVFVKYNAHDEDAAIEKASFDELFKMDPLVIQTFNNLKRQKKIKIINKKYYMPKEHINR